MATNTLPVPMRPANPEVSRRAIISGMIAAPAFVAASATAAQTKSDAPILAAWHTRQAALKKIETRGNFYYAETHSPVETEAFDKAEMAVANLPASTPAGVIAKLWVALSHMGGQIASEEDRAESDLMRRAHLPAVSLLKRDLDFDLHVMVSAIEALTVIAEGC